MINRDHKTTQTKVYFDVLKESNYFCLCMLLSAKRVLGRITVFCEAVLKKKTKSVNYMCKISVTCLPLSQVIGKKRGEILFECFSNSVYVLEKCENKI